MVEISPSVLAADFTKLGEEVLAIQNAGADMVHLDVMDGKFVPNISFGMPIIAALRKVSTLFFDVHLMIEEPIRYVERFRAAGADLITVHVEACDDPEKTLLAIRDTGAMVGLSVKPATSISSIRHLLPLCDLLLVMTVEPGYGGQALIPETLDKVSELRALITQMGLTTKIQVDGGIKPANAKAAIDAGATVLVAGSSVFNAEDRAKAINDLRL